MQQAAGYRELLLHAARQFARQVVRAIRDLELFEQRQGARLMILDSVEARDEGEMLPDRQVVEESRLVGEECELLLGLDWLLHDVVPADAHVALRGRDD